jgi:hypothetical protein
MINELRHRVQTALSGAQSPAVLFSGGKDSLLLLRLALDARSDLRAIWFRTGEPDRFTKQVLQDWAVPTLSWNPADVYLLADDNNTALIQEYDFGGGRLPVITDLSPGRQCSRMLPQLVPALYPGFDVLLWGAKDCDTHWIKGSANFPPDGTMLGAARLYAPLRHLTDEQVLAAIEELGLSYTPQLDTLPMCTACMSEVGEVYCPELARMIPSVAVDLAPALTAFRNRFVLEA